MSFVFAQKTAKAKEINAVAAQTVATQIEFLSLEHGELVVSLGSAHQATTNDNKKPPKKQQKNSGLMS